MLRQCAGSSNGPPVGQLLIAFNARVQLRSGPRRALARRRALAPASAATTCKAARSEDNCFKLRIHLGTWLHKWSKGGSRELHSIVPARRKPKALPSLIVERAADGFYVVRRLASS